MGAKGHGGDDEHEYDEAAHMRLIMAFNLQECQNRNRRRVGDLIISLYYMSFCQKHRNHHCAHSHSCNKHPQASKRQIPNAHKKTAEHQNRKPQGMTCVFEGGRTSAPSHNQDSHNHNSLNPNSLEAEPQAKRAAEAITVLEEKNRVLVLENSHLKAQIQHYRQQFVEIVEKNAVEGKQQIKRANKKANQLQLKLGSLNSENNRLQSQYEKIKTIVKEGQADRQRQREKLVSKEEQYRALYQELKQVHKEREQLKAMQENSCKEEARREQQYQMLKQELLRQQQTLTKQLQHLESQLRTANISLAKTNSEKQRAQSMFQLERTHDRQKIQMLQKKLAEEKQKSQALQNSLQQITIKSQELQDDLIHSQALLQKQIQMKAEVQALSDQIEANRSDFKPSEPGHNNHKLNGSAQKNEKQIVPSKGEDNSSQDLKEEVRMLREQIREMETRAQQSIQEVVVRMGASEAMLALLEEKNRVIKKLIREKGQIYDLVGRQAL